MLTHKTNTAIFGATMVLLLVLHFYVTPIHPLAFILPPIAYIVLLVRGSASITSSYHLPVVCNAASNNNNEIAFSFDDGPDPEITPKVLEILNKHQITAVFFCIGRKIPGNEKLLHDIHLQGHQIANHSYSHAPFIDFYSTGKWEDELTQTNQLIKKVIEREPLWFRPPYGVTTPNIADAVEKLKLTTIGWDVRSLDTLKQSPEKIVERVTAKINSGSIILFHDTNERILAVLEQTIAYCKKNGFKIVSPQALLQLKSYV